MTALLSAILSAVAAFIGSWLAARFALDRFRHEKIWEKRAAAYTAIFDMLQELQTQWMDESDIDHKAFVQAREIFNRRLASESWLMSSRFSEIVRTIERNARFRNADRIAYSQIVSDTVPELRDIARSDLSVEEPGYAKSSFFWTRWFYRGMKRRVRRMFRGQLT